MALADDILRAVPGVVRRRTWLDQLPEEAVAELLEVRRRFREGEYGPKLKPFTLGQMVVQHCRERGWHTSDARRMAEWLKQND